MRKPEARTMEVSSLGLIRKLSTDLYRDLAYALLELFTNAFDAASRACREPEIEVIFWEKGSHPLFPDTTVLSILDNGCGMDDMALKGYFRLGESLFANVPNRHATHGVGRIGAFALENQDNLQTYYVISSCDDQQAWMFDVNPRTLFTSETTFKPINRIDRKLKVPMTGSFTQILIPDYNPKINPSKIAAKLTRILPMRPWTIKIQGELVERRKINTQIVETTPHIPALGGIVRFDLGTVERRGGKYEDPILFVDADTGRLVTDLKGISNEVAHQISAEFFSPQVFGAIFVPGLERQRSASGTDMNMSFWESPAGEALIDVINSYGVEALRKLLGPQNSEGSSRIDTALAAISVCLEQVFGKPVIPKPIKTKKTTQVLVKRKKNDEPCPPRNPSNTDPDKTHKPKTNIDPDKKNDTEDDDLVCETETTNIDELPGLGFIRIENVTYQVAKSRFEPEEALLEIAPVEAIRQRTIQIWRNHPHLVRAERSTRIYNEMLLLAMVEAHVISTRLALADTAEQNNMLNDVYRILEPIMQKLT